MPFHDGALTQAVAELWLQGMTGGQIAAKLSRDLRRTITREAVMGRIHRLRQKHPGALAKRTFKAQPRKPRVRTERNLRFRGEAIKVKHTVPLPTPLTVLAEALPLTMLSLPSGASIPWHSSRGCRYIGNDDPNAPAWCNAPIVPGSAWCAYHHQRLRTPARR